VPNSLKLALTGMEHLYVQLATGWSIGVQVRGKTSSGVPMFWASVIVPSVLPGVPTATTAW